MKQTVLDGVANGNGLLLYLGSPSVFDDGWRPPFNEREHGVVLKAAAVDPPRIIAGWNVGKRQPKPPLRVVPAGATYFYRVADQAKAAKLVEGVHFNDSVSTLHPHLGFGLALCGIWEG